MMRQPSATRLGRRHGRELLCTLAVCIVAMTVASPEPRAPQAQELAVSQRRQREYSPFLDDRYPQRPLWGDTHVHTSYSTDAGMIGNRLGPEEAYKFARGEIVVASSGIRARLQRPLDFLVISDHAENLGLAPMIAESNPDLLRTAFGPASTAW